MQRLSGAHSGVIQKQVIDHAETIGYKQNSQQENSSNEKPESSETSSKAESSDNISSVVSDVNTDEVEKFVDQFAIGLNKIKLQDTTNLESNTLLLYIAQQYFTAKSTFTKNQGLYSNNILCSEFCLK